ncbi:MAG: rod shape-determining protein MreD [Ignavibacteriales bacterium]|nr:rod shape-determining protein MreD [Ignavibacteriales bacterium]
MRVLYFKAIVLFLILAILQLTIIPFLSYRQIAPDLILILLVYFTLQMGQLNGIILGCMFGLLFDLFSGGIIGSAMFSKTLSGFVAGYFFNENKIDENIKSFMLLFIILVVGTLDSIVYSFFSTNELQTNFVVLFFEQGILPGLYSACIAIPLIIFYSKKIYT